MKTTKTIIRPKQGISTHALVLQIAQHNPIVHKQNTQKIPFEYCKQNYTSTAAWNTDADRPPRALFKLF